MYVFYASGVFLARGKTCILYFLYVSREIKQYTNEP